MTVVVGRKASRTLRSKEPGSDYSTLHYGCSMLCAAASAATACLLAAFLVAWLLAGCSWPIHSPRTLTNSQLASIYR